MDDVAPMVLAVSPENGEAGLPNDTHIEITFSEPMNKAATQAAFQSASLGDVTFDWPSDDVLIVVPSAPLQYATGTSLTTAAKTYAFSITRAAEDEAGNTATKTTISEFSTLRQITTVVPELAATFAYADGDGTVTPTNLAEPGAGVEIGDLPVGPSAPVNYRRALLVFDISSLPVGIQSFVAASLQVSSCCVAGNPALLGAVWVHHVFVSPIDIGYFNQAPLDTPGVLTNVASAGMKTVSVLEALEDDYTKRVARGNQAQFRVQFAVDRNDNIQADGLTLDKAGGGAGATQIAATFLIE